MAISVFNEGEPLDVNSLNNLQTQITDMQKSVSDLTSSFSNQKQPTVAIIDAGEYIFTGGTGTGTAANSGPIPFSKTFDEIPKVIATVNKDAAGIYCVAAARADKNNIYLHINASAASAADVTVNWVAIYNKPIV